MLNMRRSVLGVIVAGIAAFGLSTTALAQKEAPKTAKVGEPAPAFELTDTDGKTHKLADLKGKVVVLEWFNPGCPYVVKHNSTNTTMNDTHAKFKDKGVVWLKINSGAPGKQGADPKENAQVKTEWKINSPILLDPTGTVGMAYGAKRTPEMYIISTDGVLMYHGAIDDNASAATLGKTNHVEVALRQVLAGETVSTPETKAYGCAVKYGS